MNCQLTLSLGVYVLGAADARERMRIEAHLPGCSACREELTRLAPVPELLARLPQDMVPDCVPADPAKIRQRTQIRLRQAPARAWRRPATAAAALLLGMAGGLSLGHGGTGQRPAAPAASFSGVNPAAGLSATAALHGAAAWHRARLGRRDPRQHAIIGHHAWLLRAEMYSQHQPTASR